MKRFDLQILRAFAVVIVFLYHLELNLFSGGFIGVDIFFVITGFFVAQMLSNGKYNLASILNFYHRRVVRLVPNLIFYLLLSIPPVLILYPPHLLKDFGQSIVANSMFISNIFFYYETDYYDDFSKTAPLLHTWSLALEVQYYVLFGIIAFIFRHRKYIAIVSIVSLSLISFLSAVSMMFEDKTAVFYMLQFRFWEFAIGYFVFFLQNIIKINKFKTALAAMSYSILFLICVRYSASTAFPGLAALPVVAATALLLLIKLEFDKDTVFKKILVSIGDRSYSIYLSHNILIAVVATSFAYLSTTSFVLIITAGTFVISEVSYRFIERNKLFTAYGLKTFYAGMSVILFILSVFGFYLHNSNGLRSLKLEQERTSEFFLDYDLLREERVAFVEDKILQSELPFGTSGDKVLILGDSKSEDLFILLNSVNRSNTHYRRLRLDDNCMKNPNTASLNKICEAEISNVMRSPLLSDANRVILTATWQRRNISDIIEFVQLLEDMNKSVAIVSTANFQDASSIALQLHRISERDFSSFFYESIRNDWRRQYLELKSELTRHTSAQFFEKLELFCVLEEKKCDLMSPKSGWLIYDSGHLTVNGFRELSKVIDSISWGRFFD